MALTDRQKDVMNWSTQEIDQEVKLGDKIDEMLATDGGMFSEEDHALVDHEGLTGIPSIEGLLDETAHDVLDHTGLTGVLSTPAENQASSTEQTSPTVVEFNALLDKLKASGLMVADDAE